MRRLVLSVAVFASAAMLVPSASAQQMPMGNGYGAPGGAGTTMMQGTATTMTPGYTMQQAPMQQPTMQQAPMGCGAPAMPMRMPMSPCGPRAPMATAPAATAAAAVPAVPMTARSCEQQVLRSAYPLVVQMLTYTSAAQAYPMGPNGRPIITAPWAYPGFGGIYTPPQVGTPDYTIAGLFGIQNVGALSANPQIYNPFALAGGNYGDLVANVFSAISAQQGIIGNRLSAATLNLAMSDYPNAQADHLGSALGALLTYGERVCAFIAPESKDSGDSDGNGNGSSSGGTVGSGESGGSGGGRGGHGH